MRRRINEWVSPARRRARRPVLRVEARNARFGIARSLAVTLALALVPAAAARTVTDETGRTVTVPDRVTRVVSLTPAITNTVFALGAGEQVVGVTDYTAFPPEARTKPSVGDLLRPSLERIVAARPDVVLAMSTLNSPDTIRALARARIPVFLVAGQDLAGLYRSIDSIGRVLGREREAAALGANLRAREARLRAQSLGKHAPTALLLLSLDPCITAGRGAFLSEMISLAGARSVTADLAAGWIRMSPEALLPRNPRYLLALMDAPFTPADLRARPGWSGLEAVREGRILRLDDRLQVPGPVAFDGLEEFARQLRRAEAAK